MLAEDKDIPASGPDHMTQDKHTADIRQAPELKRLWADCMENWLNPRQKAAQGNAAHIKTAPTPTIRPGQR